MLYHSKLYERECVGCLSIMYFVFLYLCEFKGIFKLNAELLIIMQKNSFKSQVLKLPVVSSLIQALWFATEASLQI